jgi:hypothetical protein
VDEARRLIDALWRELRPETVLFLDEALAIGRRLSSDGAAALL